MFLDTLTIYALPRAEMPGSDTQLYRVEGEFRFQSEHLGLISVPKGMLTDFASVPRFAENVIPNDDPDVLYPSVIHDFLYSKESSAAFPDVNRDDADHVLLEAMRSIGAPAWKADMIFTAVRVGGESHFRK